MRKVERLVNLIALLLDTRRPLTLDQVAELVPGYDASGESLRRMFERDKEELRSLGVPVERAPIDAWGSEEGYFIDPEAYGMPELDLAPDERAALALAARAWSGGSGGLPEWSPGGSGATRDPAAVAGLAKLDLDPGAGPDALRANLDGASPLLAVLLEATSGRKQVVFSYRPPGREAAERRLDPYALVNRRGTWYVVGHDADREALRSFRVSRIASDIRKVRPTSRGPDFEVPAGFDPGKVLPTAGEPEGAPMALVRAARATARLAELRGAVPIGPPRPDGLVTLRLPVGDRDGLLGWAMGNSVEIVEPADLRDQARRSLEDLRELVR
jgi:predicted DNA-binding transcriptional regulator YafY